MKRFLAAALATLFASSAWAQIPILTGPQDPASLQATINALINAINALPAQQAFPQPSPSSGAPTLVNTLVLTGTATGSNPYIQPGGTSVDANAGLGLNALGSGNITLFPFVAGQAASTGVLQFGNAASIESAAGLALCPGFSRGQANPPGLSSTIKGYIVTLDWLGRRLRIPFCS